MNDPETVAITELMDRAARIAGADGTTITGIDRLSIIRSDHPTAPIPALCEASMCLIVQGSKRVSLGGQTMAYGAGSYLLASFDLPVTGTVLEASPSEPYLCVKLDLDHLALADLSVACPLQPRLVEPATLAVYDADADLLDASRRLLRLLDEKDSAEVLAPLIEREILYRLLRGPHGGMLARIASGETTLRKIGKAIAFIRDGFRGPLPVSQVAEAAGMSVSSLHKHFKAVTMMTPLAYQKQLRLQEARRLMTAESATATTAAYAVGYHSPSQFSREYRRLFGRPPRADTSAHAASRSGSRGDTPS